MEEPNEEESRKPKPKSKKLSVNSTGCRHELGLMKALVEEKGWNVGITFIDRR
jgi:hypothetical protein